MPSLRDHECINPSKYFSLDQSCHCHTENIVLGWIIKTNLIKPCLLFIDLVLNSLGLHQSQSQFPSLGPTPTFGVASAR